MVIVCRPQPDAERTVDYLRARGVQAEARPLLERQPIAAVEWPTAADLVFVTSPYAAALTIANKMTAEVVALGKRTSQIFREAGIEPRLTADGGAEGLAIAFVTNGLAGRVFYPVSRAAAMEQEHHAATAVLRAVCELTVQAVYDTTPSPRCEELVATAPAGATWWFHSPSAVRAFLAHAEAQPARVVCSGGSTERAWRELKPEAWPDADDDSTIDKEPE
jgi:uroporphyrinogen-III synthase